MIEGGLRDSGSSDDRIDANRPDAFLVEKVVGGIEDSLSSRRRRPPRSWGHDLYLSKTVS